MYYYCSPSLISLCVPLGWSQFSFRLSWWKRALLWQGEKEGQWTHAVTLCAKLYFSMEWPGWDSHRKSADDSNVHSTSATQTVTAIQYQTAKRATMSLPSPMPLIKLEQWQITSKKEPKEERLVGHTKHTLSYCMTAFIRLIYKCLIHPTRRQNHKMYLLYCNIKQLYIQNIFPLPETSTG